MPPQGEASTHTTPVRFVAKRTIKLSKKLHRFEPPFRFVSEKVISLGGKSVDRFVPDSLLLLFMNTLDKRIPPEVIDGVIGGLDALPPKVRSSMITAADRYIPDTVANSRKLSAVIAGIYKYIPDRIIPPDSVEDWSHVKTRFHIPTLLSRGQSKSPKE